MKRLLLILAFTVSATAADKVTYDDHIKEIFRGACFKCHNPDKAKGDLDLTTYTTTMLGGGSGSIVEPGDPDASFLYAVMTHAEEPEMPPDSNPRPKAELDLVKQWILDGVLENKSSKARVAAKPKMNLALTDAPTGRPEGPPPMPQDLSLEPVTRSKRNTAVTAMHASPWAPVMAMGGQQQVVLYHTDSHDLLGVLPFPEGVPYSVRFSRNGKLLLAGGGVDANIGTTVLFDLINGDRLTKIGEDFDSILASDVSGDQKYIATGGPDKYLNLYDIASGEQVHHLKKHTDWVTALRFSPDAVLIASGDRNGNVFVWESETGILFYDLRGHKGAITSLSWRPDSNVLASGSEDGTVKLWNMHDGKQIKSWNAHGGGVLDMTYSMDGRIVSSGRDKIAKLWDGNGTQQRAFPAMTDIATSVTVSHDSKKIYCADWNGKVTVFNADDAKPFGEIQVNPARIDEVIAWLGPKIVETRKPWDDAVAKAKAAKANADKLAAEMPALEQALAAATSKAAEMEKQRQAAEAARNKAKQDADTAQQAKTAADKKMQDATTAKTNSDKALADATATLAPMKAQLAKTQAAEAAHKKASDAINAANAALKQRQGELATFTAARDAVTKTVNAAKAQVAKQQPAIKPALDALTAAKAKVAAADQKKAEAAKIVPPPTAERDSASKALADAARQFEVLAKQTNATPEAVAQAKQKLDAAKQQSDALLLKFQASTTAMAEANKLHATAVAARTAATAKHKAATDALNAAKAALAPGDQKLAAATKQHAAGNRAKAEAEKQVNTAKAELAKFPMPNPNAGSIAAQLKDAEGKLAGLTDAVKKAQATLAQAQQGQQNAVTTANQKTAAVPPAEQALASAGKNLEGARSQVVAANQSRDAKSKEVTAAIAAADEAGKAAADKPAMLKKFESDLKRYEVAKVNLGVRAARDVMKAKEMELLAIQHELEAAKQQLEAEKATYQSKFDAYQKLKQQ